MCVILFSKFEHRVCLAALAAAFQNKRLVIGRVLPIQKRFLDFSAQHSGSPLWFACSIAENHNFFKGLFLKTCNFFKRLFEKSRKNKLEKFRREYEKEKENIEKSEISIEEAQKALAAGRKFLAELPAKF